MDHYLTRPLQDIKTYKIVSTSPCTGTDFSGRVYFEFEIPVNNVCVLGDSYAVIELSVRTGAGDLEGNFVSINEVESGINNNAGYVFFDEIALELNGVEVDKVRYPYQTELMHTLVTKSHDKVLRNTDCSNISILDSILNTVFNNEVVNEEQYTYKRNLYQSYDSETQTMVIVVRNNLFKEGGNIVGNNRVRVIYRIDSDWVKKINAGEIPAVYMGEDSDDSIRYEVLNFDYYSLQYQSLDVPINRVIQTDYVRLFSEQRQIAIGTKTTEFDVPIEPSEIRMFCFMLSKRDGDGSPEAGTFIEKISVNYKGHQYPHSEYFFGNSGILGETDVLLAYNDFLSATGAKDGTTSLSLREWRTKYPIFVFSVFQETTNRTYRNVIHFKITFIIPLEVNTLLTVVPFTRFSFEQQYNEVAFPVGGVKMENKSYAPNKTGPQLQKEDAFKSKMEEIVIL